MRNKITLLSAAFVLLIIGKVGNIGTLAQLAYWKIFAVLGADLFIDFLSKMDEHYLWGHRIWLYLKRKQIRDIVKRDLQKAKDHAERNH